MLHVINNLYYFVFNLMLSRTSDVPIAVRGTETFVSFESSVCYVACYSIYSE